MNHKKILAITLVLLIGLAHGRPVLALSGSARPSARESSLTSAGETAAMVDFNGDGFADLAIGVPGETVGTSAKAGDVNVLYGGAGGLSAAADQLWTQNSPEVEGESNPDDAFGWALATGDFDADGFTDLAVGVPGENIDGNLDAGAVNVLYGAAGGLSAARDQFWSQNVVDLEGVANPIDNFGYALAAGDFDGDGYADLAIGVPNEDLYESISPEDHLTDAGAVNVLYGTTVGLSVFEDQFWVQDNTGETSELGDRFGYSLAVGNFGNSSHADLAVGVPGEDVGGNVDAGAVNVLYGSTGGLSETGAQFWSQDSTDVEGDANPGDNFGWALAAADFGNSLHADLAAGVPGENIDVIEDAGAANVLYGSAAGLSATGDQLWSQDSTGILDAADAGDQFGWALVAADFGKSAQADLAVGVPYEDIGPNVDAGAVNVLYGSAVGLSAARDQYWHQNIPDVEGDANTGDAFGWALAAANFGKSVQADLAVGVPLENISDSANSGAVQVLYGRASGLFAGGDQFWHQDSPDVEGAASQDDNFGWSLAAGR